MFIFNGRTNVVCSLKSSFMLMTIPMLLLSRCRCNFGITLRYGWSNVGWPDYGLSIREVALLNRNKFTPDAQIEFNSCNTGTQTETGNLAQEIAHQTGRPVEAWTGRTSYAGINRGTCSIGPSTVTGIREFFSEQVHSRWIHGRVPRKETFQPATPQSE